MLVRDRASRVRIRTSPYICSSCLSRAYGTQPLLHARTRAFSPPNHERPCIVGFQRRFAPSSHPFSTSWIPQGTEPASAPSRSPIEDVFQSPANLSFENPEDVRSYLKKWSENHQKSVKDNAPDRVQLQRDAVLPNSLFIRNSNEVAGAPESYTDADPNAGGAQAEYDAGMEDGDGGPITKRAQLHPGDVLRIVGRSIRAQLAIFLGNRGVQSLYFLADGRWLADTRTIFNSHIIRGVATDDEVSRLQKHLPLRTIEYARAEDGATVPFSAVGEIPHTDSRSLLDKLAKLTEEVEVARREYLAVNDRIYNVFADEHEFKHEKLEVLLRDILHVDHNTLNDGAKLFLHQAVSEDERFTILHAKDNKILLYFLPKTMHRSSVQVTEWARSYQDAAARAAIGRSVSEELQKNPLIPFISKARRLVSKSRKIRLPTMECELGPTLENMRPAHGGVERRPSGEEFTEDEKKIIEFLWLVYAKRPLGQTVGTKRNTAIASMIVRAVGAYPKFRLDLPTGMLFLKELGCLDPWSIGSEHTISTPVFPAPLHQASRLMREKARKAAADYGMLREDEVPRLPDTMAHLRHDWGDLEVFCIDSSSTVIKDDGISIETSKEFPNHRWIRIHIAHISAYVAPDSPLLALGGLVGAAQYHMLGSEPYIPIEALRVYSLKSGSSVLTISTLLGPDGSIKDIDIRPGTVRNVVDIHSDIFEKTFCPPSTSNTLFVGPHRPTPSEIKTFVHGQITDHEGEQLQLIQRHRATLDLLKETILSRWNARFDANPHLQMFKLPNTQVKLALHPNTAYSEGAGHERIFRSEHVVGDPSIIAKCTTSDFGLVRYRDQRMGKNVVAGCMMLACESAALWTSARSIPVIYRTNEAKGEFDLSSLNKLGPHDFFIAPTAAESVDMKPNPSLAVDGYMNVNNPLRKYRDIINHHQIDAYLKAQASQSTEHGEAIHYPRSRQDLLRCILEESDGSEPVQLATLQTNQWLTTALYRAFYFGEAKLPGIWDVQMDNPVNVSGSKIDEATTSKGTIYAIGVKVHFQPSEKGWEKMAKFRQWLPSKLTAINPGQGLAFCEAIGPPVDEPSVKDLAYPPMKAQ